MDGENYFCSASLLYINQCSVSGSAWIRLIGGLLDLDPHGLMRIRNTGFNIIVLVQVPGGLLQPAQVQHGRPQAAEEAEDQEGHPGLGLGKR